MKIGIDYHGVINKNPEFFKKFTAFALKKKHTVVVLSGSGKQDVIGYLNNHHISFSDIYSLLDDFKARGLVTFNDDGSFFVNNEIWNKAKAKYCRQNNVDVHIDDSLLYGVYFQTPFCLYGLEPKSCTFTKKNLVINFNQTPEKVLRDLEDGIRQISLK